MRKKTQSAQTASVAEPESALPAAKSAEVIDLAELLKHSLQGIRQGKAARKPRVSTQTHAASQTSKRRAA